MSDGDLAGLDAAGPFARALADRIAAYLADPGEDAVVHAAAARVAVEEVADFVEVDLWVHRGRLEVRHERAIERREQRDGHERAELGGVGHVGEHLHHADQRADHPEDDRGVERERDERRPEHDAPEVGEEDDHQHRQVRHVDGGLAQGFARIGRIHLVGFPVAELRRALRGFAERTIKR